MNYKRRNFIGIFSFVIIILVMINFNFILEVINYKILGIDYIGFKGEELFLSELNETDLTKTELTKYIDENFNKIGMKKLKNKDFGLYLRNIEEEDKFLEKFRLPIDEKFQEEFYKSLDLVPKNEKFLVKFVIYDKDKAYISKPSSMRLVDELYKNEGKMVIDIDKFSREGMVSYIELPKYVNLSKSSKISVNAKHEDLQVSGLKGEYDEESGKIKISNLVPIKPYSNIEITTKNLEGVDVLINIRNILMNPESKLQEYLTKVYLTSLNRYPYEEEYLENLNNLSSHNLSIREFLTKIILSDEFDSVNTSPKQIVDSIYYMVNKQSITGRLSTLIVDEFNQELLDENLKNEGKIKILDKLLQDDNAKNYMESTLGVKIN